jgi:hypothetical protein
MGAPAVLIRILVQTLPLSSIRHSPAIGESSLNLCNPTWLGEEPFPTTDPLVVYMTSRVPPVGVGPTTTRCSNSRLKSSGDNIRPPASSNSPRLLWALASDAHNNRGIPSGSLVGRPTSFSSRISAYSITSSRSTTSDEGSARPSNFAVFVLTTSSGFVCRSTGRSAGFAPFRILST